MRIHSDHLCENFTHSNLIFLKIWLEILAFFFALFFSLLDQGFLVSHLREEHLLQRCL